MNVIHQQLTGRAMIWEYVARTLSDGAARVPHDIRLAAEAMHKRHGRSVEFYINALMEEPFKGFDQKASKLLDARNGVVVPASGFKTATVC